VRLGRGLRSLCWLVAFSLAGVAGPARSDTVSDLSARPPAPCEVPPTAVSSAGGAEASTDEALFAMPTPFDRIGRIVRPVMIDTGANRSAVSPRLVAELGLPLRSGATVRLSVVTGVTGVAVVPTATSASRA